MSKYESANLILKLYETRREAVMRKARTWFEEFFPESVEDILDTFKDEQTGAYYRMVVSYWDMAAGFVNHGAIDEDMFNDANGEHFLVFSKIYPFIDEIREMWNSPRFLINLEELVMRKPDAEKLLKERREAMKEWIEKNKEMAKNA